MEAIMIKIALHSERRNDPRSFRATARHLGVDLAGLLGLSDIRGHKTIISHHESPPVGYRWHSRSSFAQRAKPIHFANANRATNVNLGRRSQIDLARKSRFDSRPKLRAEYVHSLLITTLRRMALSPCFDYVDNDLARVHRKTDMLVCIPNGGQAECRGIDTRYQLAGINQARSLAKDMTVMRPALAGEQRQQGEHAGISAAPE
jgi:hypothetical protein